MMALWKSKKKKAEEEAQMAAAAQKENKVIDMDSGKQYVPGKESTPEDVKFNDEIYNDYLGQLTNFINEEIAAGNIIEMQTALKDAGIYFEALNVVNKIRSLIADKK